MHQTSREELALTIQTGQCACVKSHSPCSEEKITVFITILITRLQDRTRADTHTLENAVAQCGIRIRLTSRSRLVDVLQSCRKPTRKPAFVLPRLREDYGALKMTIKHRREWKRRGRADWLSGNQQKANQRAQNVIMSLGFVQRGTLSAEADRVEIIQTLRDGKDDAHQMPSDTSQWQQKWEGS